MSSTYYVLCMDHDPAIVIDGDWQSPDAALGAVAERTDNDRLAAHTGCDLLIGRYSYPLIEVCCPGGKHATTMHINPEWIDVAWLRLLHAAYRSKDVQVLAAAQNLTCWPVNRVHRLRVELGVSCDIP